MRRVTRWTPIDYQEAVLENFKKNSKRTQAEWKLRTEIRKVLGWDDWEYQYHVLRYVADFAHLPTKLIVEVDGSSHNHKKEYDDQRTSKLNDHGWTVIRFTNAEVFRETEKVIQKIKDTVFGLSVDSP